MRLFEVVRKTRMAINQPLQYLETSFMANYIQKKLALSCGQAYVWALENSRTCQPELAIRDLDETLEFLEQHMEQVGEDGCGYARGHLAAGAPLGRARCELALELMASDPKMDFRTAIWRTYESGYRKVIKDLGLEGRYSGRRFLTHKDLTGERCHVLEIMGVV